MDSESDFQLDFEWQDPGGAKGAELRATWASLSISIGGQSVTEAIDQRSRSVRGSIFLPLFPLAEWIADQWWFLQSEPENPDRSESMEFDRRHNLRWAREGFVLPSLRFVTRGTHIAAQWRPLEIADARIRFVASGDAVLPAGVLFGRLRDFLNAVIARLDDSAIAKTTLHEQWRAIENANADEKRFCLAAARLGVDPYSAPESLENRILEAAQSVRSDLLDDLLSLTDADHLNDHASALRSASEAIAADADGVDALEKVRNHAPTFETHANPWETGYRFAERLRKALNGGLWKSKSLNELAGHIHLDHVDHCLLSNTEDCRFLDALAGTNHRNNPKFILEKTRPDSKQFAFCRALFEHLTLPHGRFAVISKLKTERQQMNRAFAAEFLAPHEMLKNDLSGYAVGEEEIDDLAADYGVSAYVIRHQIENHGLAQVSV